MKIILFIALFLANQTASFCQTEHGYGMIPMSKLEYKKLPKLKVSSTRSRTPPPLKFYLDTPPVGDQGQMGSCVGWAVGYTFFSSFIRKIGRLPVPSPRPIPGVMVWDETNELSPSYLFNQIKVDPQDCTKGSRIWDALYRIFVQGNCPIGSMPYVDGDCNTQPTTAQRREASRYGSKPPSSYYAVKTVKDVQLYITSLISYKRPVIVGFPVYDAFIDMWNNNHGMWTKNPPVNLHGYHAVCIVGYDSQKRLFRCQNQWGASGGDSGFFWVSFDLVTQGCFTEAYVWTGSNPNPVPVPFPKPHP